MAPTPPRPTRARLENDALRHLRAIVAVQTASARSLEKRTGVTNAQLFLLQALAAAPGPMTIGELQLAVRTGQSAVSILVARLARAGLVTRATAEHDRRRRAVTLTAKGAKLAKRGPTPPLRRLLDALAEVSESDLRQLSHGLAALAAAFGVGDDDPPPLFEKPGR
jgi:DNA-binding MarR family transcriptional regulator